jgi:hypothetical protein
MGASEDECIRLSWCRHPLSQGVENELRQPNRAPTRPRLGWPDMQPALGLGDDLDHLDGAAHQIDPASAQPRHFSDTQAPIGAQQDQCSVVRPDCIGQAQHLGGGEESHLLPLDPR